MRIFGLRIVSNSKYSELKSELVISIQTTKRLMESLEEARVDKLKLEDKLIETTKDAIEAAKSGEEAKNALSALRKKISNTETPKTKVVDNKSREIVKDFSKKKSTKKDTMK
jgi:hypothetical protein